MKITLHGSLDCLKRDLFFEAFETILGNYDVV